MKAGTGKMPEIDSFLRKTQAVGSWVHPSFVKLLTVFQYEGPICSPHGPLFPSFHDWSRVESRQVITESLDFSSWNSEDKT